MPGLSPRTMNAPWPGRLARLLPGAVVGAALLVYLLTLAPGLSFAHNGTDGGDLVTAAWTLGVPHPSGYPTYTLLAWLFTRLPVGVVAYRANLLSAVCAAGAAGLLLAIGRLLWPSRLLAAAAALTLAFSSLLWSQAVIAEVYALLTLLAALWTWLLLRWRAGGSDRLLWLAGLVMGLGLGNHLTLILAVPPAVVLLWGERRRWLQARVLLPAAALGLLGLGVYAYLPLAARHQPPVNWGNPQTWDRFLWVVTGEQYQQFAFGLDPAAMPGRLAAWVWLIGDQFGWWGLALALAGGWWWWQRDRALALFALVWMLLAGVYAFFYDTGDSQAYLLPPILMLAIWWGEGAHGLWRVVGEWRPALHRLAVALVLVLPLASAGLHWQAADPDDDWLIHTYMHQAFDAVEPGALIVVRGDGPTFALWYGAYVEGQRPDVAVVSGPLLAYIWYRQQVRARYPHLALNEPAAGEVTLDDVVRDLIDRNLPERAVYATDPNEAWKVWFDFQRLEGPPMYRARPAGGDGP